MTSCWGSATQFSYTFVAKQPCDRKYTQMHNVLNKLVAHGQTKLYFLCKLYITGFAMGYNMNTFSHFKVNRKYFKF
jgi:hypothetical protein